MNATRKAARQRLDERLQPYRMIDPARPHKGWIRAIRDALGMTTTQLAKRMGVSSQAVTGLEQSEALGTARLNTLRRAAEALDATLVYALVPNTSLEKMVHDRAHGIARSIVDRVAHTMVLEGQGTPAGRSEKDIESFMDQLRDRDLWQAK